MEVSVENTDGLFRRLKVAVPEERVEGEVNSRLHTMARSASVPGFRRGRVPLKVVMQRFGRKVREEVVGDIVRSSFQDALMKENLRPASSPIIDAIRSDPGAGVAYEAVFEVYPEVSIPTLSELEVVRPVSEVLETDVDAMIVTLRKQRRTWKTTDREARHGDRVVIDFSGRCEDRPIEGGEARGVSVEIGAGRMVAGLEEGLVGAKRGDDLHLRVSFPENAPDPVVAGKQAQFDVHVHEVQEGELPEIDEEFIRGFGVANGDEVAFRAEVRSNMERELKEALRGTTKKRVMDALLARHALELPKGLVADEVNRMIGQRRMELAYRGIDSGQVGVDPAIYEGEARRRVALRLLLTEIVKRSELRADPERVRQRIETIASTYDESDKVISWYYGNRERLLEIESAILEEQVVEWILERAQVSDAVETFDALLNPGQTNHQHADE